MKCFRCGSKLEKTVVNRKMHFVCNSCGACMVSVSALRALIPAGGVVDQLWQAGEVNCTEDGSRCRVCNSLLRQVRFQLEGMAKTEIDICRGCMAFWFDRGELEMLPVQIEEKPAAGRRITSNIDLSKPMDLPADMPSFIADDSGSFFDFLFASAGLPCKSSVCSRMPFVTLSLIFLETLALVFSGIYGFNRTAGVFGFIPEKYPRSCGMTFFTSAFLHSGFLHFVFNIYFLWLAGSILEQTLKIKNMLMLFFSSLLVSKIFYLFLTAEPDIPCVGASGFVSGFIGCCAVISPLEKLSFLIRGRHRFIAAYPFLTVEIPVWIYALVWFVIQLVMCFVPENPQVAYSSHVGGAAAGVVCGFLFRYCRVSNDGKIKKSMVDEFYGN